MTINIYGLDGSILMTIEDVSRSYIDDIFFCTFSDKSLQEIRVPINLILFVQTQYKPEPLIKKMFNGEVEHGRSSELFIGNSVGDGTCDDRENTGGGADPSPENQKRLKWQIYNKEGTGLLSAMPPAAT